jgi:hypothetical protein
MRKDKRAPTRRRGALAQTIANLRQKHKDKGRARKRSTADGRARRRAQLRSNTGDKGGDEHNCAQTPETRAATSKIALKHRRKGGDEQTHPRLPPAARGDEQNCAQTPEKGRRRAKLRSNTGDITKSYNFVFFAFFFCGTSSSASKCRFFPR